MKRKSKVRVTAEVLETFEISVEDLLGLGPDDEVPPVGSDEWHEALMEIRAEMMQEMKVSVSYDNPAYDAFPGTVPLLPEHQPTKRKEWFLP